MIVLELVNRPTLVGETRDLMLQQLTERGLARDRLELRSELSDGETHLSVYNEIDIGLDVFPWSGRTTACEALWMGTLVVALVGSRPTSRGNASILTIAGLPEFVAQTPSEYVEIVRKLADVPDRITSERSSLRERLNSTLCNGPRFTATLETAFRDAFDEAIAAARICIDGSIERPSRRN